MTKFQFTKAVKSQEKLRLALDGPAGAGKTWTALEIACWLAGQDGGRVAVIDSERSSARKYAGDFDFDHLEMPDNDPRTYIEAVRTACEAGYKAIIVDSLSHAWEGTLDLKDRVQKRSTNKDGFGAWREVTPVHNELVDTMLRAPAHLIVTMRTKTEYSVDKDADGKTRITRLGLKPQQREGVEYEFDVVGDLDMEHNLIVSKSRCSALADAVINRPGQRLAETLQQWLTEGEPLANAEAIASMVVALNEIPDAESRRSAKQGFIARFGRPETLLASRVDEAAAFVHEVSAPPAEAVAALAAAAEHFDEPETTEATDPVAPAEAADDAALQPAASIRVARLASLLRETSRGEEAVGRIWAAGVLGIERVDSFDDLSAGAVERLIGELKREINKRHVGPPQSEQAVGTEPRMTADQCTALLRLLELHEIDTHELRLQYVAATLGRPVERLGDLTTDEASRLIDDLQSEPVSA